MRFASILTVGAIVTALPAGCAVESERDTEGQRGGLGGCEPAMAACVSVPPDAAHPHHDAGTGADAAVDAGGGEGHRPPSCEALDFQGCATASDCVLIHGSYVDEEKRCIGDFKPFACKSKPLGCDAALGFLRDDAGKLWQFPTSSDNCLPTGLQTERDSEERGWGGFPLCTPRQQTPNERCSEIATTSCESELGCTAIRGRQYDPIRKCHYPDKPQVIIGCRQADQPCPPAVVYVQWPNGPEAFEVASGCVPPKFGRLDYPGAIDSWPTCQ